MTNYKITYISYRFQLEFIFLLPSILSAKVDPLVCVDLVFCKQLNKGFSYFFHQKSLVRDAGKFVPSSVLVVEMKCRLHIIKELATLDNFFTIESVFEKYI